MEDKFAIIDLGSNSARLVVYRKEDVGTILEEDNIKSVLRLSSLMNQKGEISSTGVEKTIHCLKRYKQICDLRGIGQIYGIATAAVRSAMNKEDLLATIYNETGIQFRILDGNKEAYYGYLAIVNTMEYREAITIDIGGGSTEITYFKERELIESFSFPFGAVILTEKYLPSEMPSVDEIIHLKSLLQDQFSQENWIAGKKCPVIAMGGTARNIARVHQKRRQYSISSLHNYQMTYQDVEEILEWLRQVPLSKRREVNGLSKDRADIFLAGICVFLTLMESVQTDLLYTSNKGLRDGLLFEVNSKQGDVILPDVLEYGTQQFMNRYRVNAIHSQHVANLATQLFDELKKIHLHEWDESERKLLETSARLHDIGRSVNIIESTKHTRYLLENVLLIGCTHRERLIIALAASYKNNKQLQKWALSHQDILSKEDVETALKLGALIQIARFFDRMINQSVYKIQIADANKKVKINLFLKDQPWWEEQELQDHLKRLSKAFGMSFILNELHMGMNIYE